VTTSLTKPYDSIVIGAGHNGLVCATLLARVGQRVLLLEAGERVGGLAADREFHPGFHAPVANTLYALPTTVIRDLRLADYGFEMPVDTLPLVALSHRRDTDDDHGRRPARRQRGGYGGLRRLRRAAADIPQGPGPVLG
jgi:phytoene dehydrogenase-like protein